MSCGCSTNKDGKGIVDLVRGKGKQDVPTQVAHEIHCSCGKTFTMTKAVDQCPYCGMTYGVTPCQSADKNNIQAAAIHY